MYGFVKALNAYYSNFGNDTEPIWASLGMIICWQIRGIEPRALVELGVILADLRVNDYYLQLFMRMIFA